MSSFYRMIEKLFTSNELVLFGRIVQFEDGEENQVIDLINKVYQEEAVGYPYQSPIFEASSALWSAKILFHTAQLLIYREQRPDKLDEIIVNYSGDITASAILSSDICFRFLPKILEELELIDVEDALIPLLNELLKTWHYSGLLSNIDLGEPNFSETFDNLCLLQCYTNRVISQKQIKIGNLERIKPSVLSSLGAFESIFWKGFK